MTQSARAAFTLAAVVTLATIAPAQQVRPDLGGRWALDPASLTTSGGGRGDGRGNASGGGGRAGGGLGLGPPADELSIRQSDTVLVVEERRGEAPAVVVRYRFDGKKITNAMSVGRGGTTDATYSTRWEKAKLSTTITRSLTTRGGTTELRYRELLYLAPDSTLVVETTMQGRPGGRKAVYRKVN